MENLVFTIFAAEDKAAEGLQKLHDLDQLGDISVYNVQLIKKNADHSITVLQSEGRDASNLPAAGAVTGSLVGALAGPVGMAIGMMTGVMAGAADEDDYDEVYEEFLDKAKARLVPGAFALVMDVAEDAEPLIDGYMTACEGIIFRTPIDSAFAANDRRHWEQLNADIDEDERKLATAADQEKARLKAQVDKLKQQRDELHEQIRQKAQKRKKEGEEKLRALEGKISTAEGKAKEKIQHRLEKLRKSLDEYNETVDLAFK
jgi:uncharacterized membrane protein